MAELKTIEFPVKFTTDIIDSYYIYPPIKSAKEQVQDEILSKVTKAIEADDIKKAKELLKLAKDLKEL